MEYGYGGLSTGSGAELNGPGSMALAGVSGSTFEPAPAMSSLGGTVLPEQHEDQLQLGFRMISNAFSSKVKNLENELHGLRLGCEEQKKTLKEVHQKNSAWEAELVEGHQRCQQLGDENKALFKTVQNLQRQLQRLEVLKKRVQDTISDDANANDYSTETEEARLAMRDDYLQSSLPLTMGSLHYDGSVKPQSPAAPQAYGGNRVAPHPVMSAAGGLVGPSNASSRAASPPHSAPQPPKTTDSQVVDGKQFFRQARSQLSYEGFNEFLSNIKRLNNQQQTREETLEEARRIFGPDLQNLYQEFDLLLSRQAM